MNDSMNETIYTQDTLRDIPDGVTCMVMLNLEARIFTVDSDIVVDVSYKGEVEVSRTGIRYPV